MLKIQHGRESHTLGKMLGVLDTIADSRLKALYGNTIERRCGTRATEGMTAS